MPMASEDGFAYVNAAGRRADSVALLRFLSQLGHVLLATGDTVAFVESTLVRIANAHGAAHVNVVALPTVLFVKFEDGDDTHVDFTSEEGLVLRFDQIDAVYELAEEAANRRVTPRDGLARLRGVLAMRRLYSRTLGVIGHVLVTVGLALILQPSLGVVGAAVFFGALVGILKTFARHLGLFTTLLPSIAAFLVAAIALIAARHGFPASPMPVLVASLVTFLPGGTLAIAIMELAYGDVVSGGSRFVTGLVQLLFLALGMLVATSLVGLPAAQLMPPVPEPTLPWLAAWVGVALFAVGHALHFSMPLAQLPWLLLILGTAQIAVLAGGTMFGGYMGGFFGALAMTTVAYFVQHRLRGPPAVVTFPPGLWLLVPGSLGLIGLTEFAAADKLAGIDNFVTTVFTITAIALGSMLGAGLYGTLFEPLLSHAGTWTQTAAKRRKR
jgi:uncharacterized membrane protein YjjP (DUF1212 family)